MGLATFVVTLAGLVAGVYCLAFMWRHRRAIFRREALKERWAKRPWWRFPVLVLAGVGAIGLAFLVSRGVREGGVPEIVPRLVSLVLSLVLLRIMRNVRKRRSSGNQEPSS